MLCIKKSLEVIYLMSLYYLITFHTVILLNSGKKPKSFLLWLANILGSFFYYLDILSRSNIIDCQMSASCPWHKLRIKLFWSSAVKNTNENETRTQCQVLSIIGVISSRGEILPSFCVVANSVIDMTIQGFRPIWNLIVMLFISWPLNSLEHF